jgi:tryptophan synthase alpha chain
LKKKKILLMTHIVMGYPSFNDSYQIVRDMVAAGVDLMELQVPFSEPIADGPVILRANQKALERGARVKDSLEFAGRVARDFDIPFLIMSYYNILFKYGVDLWVTEMAQRNLQGAIIPDLPPEEGAAYLAAMKKYARASIQLFSPTTPIDRMKYLAALGQGFIYCVARKGVTGKDTDFSGGLTEYLSVCRQATSLPLALGFGVKERKDIQFLTGKVDIAIIGTQTIRVVEKEGIGAIGDFIQSLR